MTFREFVKENKMDIDRRIKEVSPNAKLTNKEREMWVFNDEVLYNLAKQSGVKV